MAQMPQASPLRQGRYSQSGQIYLVTAVTVQRHAVLADFFTARPLVRISHQNDSVTHAQTLAFVVVAYLFNWLFQLGENESLSRGVQRVKSMATKTIGTPIWQMGSDDRAIRREEGLRDVYRYVASNPAAAGTPLRLNTSARLA